MLSLYVYTLLQNYRERVSRRYFGMINDTESSWKWILTTLSREKIHGKSAWKRLVNFGCWQPTYQHQCHPECQIRGKVIKLASHIKPQNTWVKEFCVLCRLWQAVCNWRNLEVEIPCLYTEIANGGTRVSTTTLPRLLSWWTSAWQAIVRIMQVENSGTMFIL